MPEIAMTQPSYGISVASTFSQSGTLAASLFIAHMLSASPAVAEGWRGRNLPVISFPHASRTYSERSDAFAEMVSVPREQTTLVEFYSDFLAKQEELGRDFERALFDNVWDLYAR